MLEFHAVQEIEATTARLVELLQEFKATLQRDGMASMDEYGDLLNWGLPNKNGMSRSLHVFDPGYCSFSDQFYGTIHFHGGEIRGTILAGEVEHYTYQATKDANGDRFYADDAYTLTKHTRRHGEGMTYILPARVPHWIRPTMLTMTYFEEEDNGEMGDLVNPVTKDTDSHVWTQAEADALLPRLLAMIDERLARLSVLV